MARYIDADEALKQIKELQKTDPATVGKKQFAEGFFLGLDETEVILMRTSTVDVVEVKHGYLTYDPFLLDFTCSVCGYKQKTKGAYCCNCSAKMDGKDKNVPANGRSDI